MARLLPEFLRDRSQYEQAESIWRGLWSRIVRELGQEADWQTPWLNTCFNNGDPFLDGNPIFSAVCPSRSLGIRIIQVEPEDDPEDFSDWTDTFGDGEPGAIKELVIHCILSEETLGLAEDRIKQWISAETQSQSRCAS